MVERPSFDDKRCRSYPWYDPKNRYVQLTPGDAMAWERHLDALAMFMDAWYREWKKPDWDPVPTHILRGGLKTRELVQPHRGYAEFFWDVRAARVIVHVPDPTDYTGSFISLVLVGDVWMEGPEDTEWPALNLAGYEYHRHTAGLVGSARA